MQINIKCPYWLNVTTNTETMLGIRRALWSPVIREVFGEPSGRYVTGAGTGRIAFSDTLQTSLFIEKGRKCIKDIVQITPHFSDDERSGMIAFTVMQGTLDVAEVIAEMAIHGNIETVYLCGIQMISVLVKYDNKQDLINLRRKPYFHKIQGQIVMEFPMQPPEIRSSYKKKREKENLDG